VLVMPGKVASMTAKQLRQRNTGINEQLARHIEGERAPAPVVKEARTGDMFTTMTEVPQGVATACALALPVDLADPTIIRKIDATATSCASNASRAPRQPNSSSSRFRRFPESGDLAEIAPG
jgi:hypothetical protein